MLHVIRPSLLVALLLAALAGACARSTPPPPEVRTPNPDVGVDTLASRRTAQLEAARQFRAFHEFHFTDAVKESGITFTHHIVEDAGKHYKAVHYDHGN